MGDAPTVTSWPTLPARTGRLPRALTGAVVIGVARPGVLQRADAQALPLRQAQVRRDQPRVGRQRPRRAGDVADRPCAFTVVAGLQRQFVVELCPRTGAGQAGQQQGRCRQDLERGAAAPALWWAGVERPLAPSPARDGGCPIVVAAAAAAPAAMAAGARPSRALHV
jgi:hypothetical protein